MRKSGFLFFVSFLIFPVGGFPAGAWRTIESGWDYQKISIPMSHEATASVHFFRIDPARFRFNLLLASDFGASAIPVGRYREKSRAALVINGGFFDQGFRPLGLLQRQGKVLNRLRNAPWGIFSLGEGGPSILHRKDWKEEGSVMAIQVGPRLVVNGQIPKFKEGAPTRRSALGITAEGWLVIALSEAPLTLQQWAEWLLKGGCVQALNLDGGGSSQLAVRLKDFSLDISGATGVPNALVVFPR